MLILTVQAANQVMFQANMTQETRPGTQFPSSGTQLLTNEEDWRMKFSEEGKQERETRGRE